MNAKVIVIWRSRFDFAARNLEHRLERLGVSYRRWTAWK